ncbi:hypothetical protein Bca52824_043625 [Brassica carinata]|uniref:FBD domain-containing protein n=1 Tax=Brassica carinata TaxID=52824 RepID=A0A8X7V0W3_BRACI|nr:hypothetical protein Bca52824_043625 [Brassica carinata]
MVMASAASSSLVERVLSADVSAEHWGVRSDFGGYASERETLGKANEEMVPSGKGDKPFWARGIGVLGYSLNAFWYAEDPNRRSQVTYPEDTEDQLYCLGSEPSSVPKCLSFHLENIQWTGYGGTLDEREATATIRLQATCMDDGQIIMKDVTSMSKASASCQLVIE